MSKAKAPSIPVAVVAFTKAVSAPMLAYCNAIDSGKESGNTFTNVLRAGLLSMYDAAKDTDAFDAYVLAAFGSPAKGKKEPGSKGTLRALLPEAHAKLGSVTSTLSQARRVAKAMSADESIVESLRAGTLRGTHDEIAKAAKIAQDGVAPSNPHPERKASEAVTLEQLIARDPIAALRCLATIFATDKTTKLQATKCAAIATELEAA